MTVPDISVIIPCFNAESWIAAAVESVLSHNEAYIEVIVVNDGSNDSCSEILAGFGPRIHVIEQQNAGVSAARNAGVAAAKGEYLCFLDADDLFGADPVTASLELARMQQGSVIVGRTNVTDATNLLRDSGAYNLAYNFQTGTRIDPAFLLAQATHSSLWMIPNALFGTELRFPVGIGLGEEYGFVRKLVQTAPAFIACERTFCTVRDHNGPRLSRSGKEADYLAQLDQMKENASLILVFAGDRDHPAFAMLARRIWVLGRDCLRLGYHLAAKRHFELASTLLGRRAISGHWSYRVVASLLGPVRAETTFTFLKLGRSRRTAIL